MNTQAAKKEENKSQSVANSSTQTKNKGESTFHFVDNRPETDAQRSLQKMANNSPQAKQAVQLQAQADGRDREAGKVPTLKAGQFRGQYTYCAMKVGLSN